MFQTKFV